MYQLPSTPGWSNGFALPTLFGTAITVATHASSSLAHVALTAAVGALVSFLIRNL